MANVSRVVTSVVDRITGDRNEVPLFVAGAAVQALKAHGIECRVMYGAAAWIEILEDHSVVWAGCWGQNLHFWVATAYGEVVDLNTAVAYRKRAHRMIDGQVQTLSPLYSPPILWSIDVPKFYRYHAEGVAEVDLTETRDQKQFATALDEIREKCRPELIRLGAPESELEFANEPILVPDRRVLDDSNETFKQFERAIGVLGIPSAPF